MTTTEATVAAGSAAPDLELDSAAGVPIRLATLWADRPIVLVFIGDPNTPATAENGALVQDAQPAFEHVGALPVCVLRGSQAGANSLARERRLVLPLLCDTAGTAAEAFGVPAEQPALFVIDTKGTVRYARVGAGPLDLPSAQEVALVVSSITGAVGFAADSPQPNGGAQPSVPTPKGRSTMPGGVYTCAKCGSNGYDIATLSTAGGWLSRLFNFQYRKFAAVSCTSCSFTELYKRTSGALSNIADILAGS